MKRFGRSLDILNASEGRSTEIGGIGDDILSDPERGSGCIALNRRLSRINGQCHNLLSIIDRIIDRCDRLFDSYTTTYDRRFEDIKLTGAVVKNKPGILWLLVQFTG